MLRRIPCGVGTVCIPVPRSFLKWRIDATPIYSTSWVGAAPLGKRQHRPGMRPHRTGERATPSFEDPQTVEPGSRRHVHTVTESGKRMRKRYMPSPPYTPPTTPMPNVDDHLPLPPKKTSKRHTHTTCPRLLQPPHAAFGGRGGGAASEQGLRTLRWPRLVRVAEPYKSGATSLTIR